ncbi:NAD(P)-dependent oxidoreductase [Streptomyces yaizuensis]|uniref:NAD(P)-binding domain-containing protein n=1 Tax=Streptomyces yaizuensis TaxID=2989713 RepID=A0ABQ5P899_9ACTN|nr:NAD(P)-binding domain-containing protein [Streptomyces sp. YSPA8]GLF98809.1 NAD(P)-binding domain-containing protein [Streptomyces sp. YSPA8]
MTAQQPTTAPRMPVAVVGLGPMGIVLAETCLRGGHPLTVWNRTAARADDLVARGARRAGSVAEAVAAAEVVIVCLKDYDAMYAAFGDTTRAAGSGRPGPLVVNLNSGTPQEAREAVEWAASRGFGYLDGAIMVPPPLVGSPDAVFLYSGPREHFDTYTQALETLGSPRYLGPDPGLAVLYNTALLEMMYATMNGWLHAAALVGSAGVAAADFAELAHGWFTPAVLSPASFRADAPDLDRAEYPGDLGTLHMNLNAIEHILRTSREVGVPDDQPRLMKEIAERAIAAGYGEQNYYAIFETFRT